MAQYKRVTLMMKQLLPLVVAICVAMSAASGEIARISRHDTVSVRADEAWEDAESSENVVHFRGHFEIRGRDWSVSAEEATLYGPLEDPDRIVAAKGARVRFNTEPDSTRKPVEGQADRIEYQRDGDIVTLKGNARLLKQDNTMQAATIEYNRATDAFRAGGKGSGVQIMFTPQDEESPEKQQ